MALKILTRNFPVAMADGLRPVFSWTAEDVPGPGWWAVVVSPRPRNLPGGGFEVVSAALRVLMSTDIDFGADPDQPIPIPPEMDGRLEIQNLGLQTLNAETDFLIYLVPLAVIKAPLFTQRADLPVANGGSAAFVRPVRSRRFYPFVGFGAGAGTIKVAQLDAAAVPNELDSTIIQTTTPRLWIPYHEDCRTVEITNNVGNAARLAIKNEMAV